MKHRTNIRLDDQAREDAQRIAKEYGLGSVSAAVRFALREAARRVETKQDDGPKITRRVRDTDQGTAGSEEADKGAIRGSADRIREG